MTPVIQGARTGVSQLTEGLVSLAQVGLARHKGGLKVDATGSVSSAPPRGPAASGRPE